MPTSKTKAKASDVKNADPIDLLTTPIFTIVADDGSTTAPKRFELSLAGLLARLGKGEPTELANLMPHQQHVMHAFLVQLAVLVCASSDDRRLDRSEDEWRDAVRAIAGCDEAFQLVVDDLTRPAFLQPPVPEKTLSQWTAFETPDALDILLTAKNHDVKSARFRFPRVEHWVYALVSLQTQQGFLGAGNWGIARMNGGFGNRAALGLTPSLDFANRFRRDVTTMIEARANSLATGDMYRPNGLALVWLRPWDGLTSLSLKELDPAFIEVCRRIRCAYDGLHLVARGRPTKSPRIDAKDLKGDIGDHWTSVDRESGAALTLGGNGFEYGRLSALLFSDNWKRPPAAEVCKEDGAAPYALARALVRGQGKTEGLHERVVPVPAKARSLFISGVGRTRLGTLAQQRVEAAKSLRLRVLKPALCALLQGGGDDLRLDDERPDALLREVDRSIDAEFFARLFDDIEEAAEVQRTKFETWLLELGKRTFSRGIHSLPIPLARRERAIATAEARFWGAARKHLSSAFQANQPTQENP